jgi:hypothetical protein
VTGGVGNTQKDPERFASLDRDSAERPHLEEWRQRGW